MEMRKKLRLERSAFAIFLAMILMVLVILIGVYLVEKLVPASKSVKGIEQGNMAYYLASSAVEEALLSMSGANPGSETGATVGVLSGSGYSFFTVASGSVVPATGLGNSEFASDHDWNVFALGRPVQLKIPAGTDPGAIEIRLRIPDLDRDGFWGETGGDDGELLSGTTTPIVNWGISGSGEAIVAESGAVLSADDVNLTANLTLAAKTGRIISSDTGALVSSFVTGVGNCLSASCTLKLSIVRPLILRNGTAAPYLEYQIGGPLGTAIPQQWTRISAEGYVRGFKQTVRRDVEQLTTNEALDFAVFQ